MDTGAGAQIFDVATTISIVIYTFIRLSAANSRMAARLWAIEKQLYRLNYLLADLDLTFDDCGEDIQPYEPKDETTDHYEWDDNNPPW